MKLIPFSNELCQQLMDIGYIYFVTARERADAYESMDVRVFEALRKRPLVKFIFIKHVMNLPEETAKRYFVLYAPALKSKGLKLGSLVEL